MMNLPDAFRAPLAALFLVLSAPPAVADWEAMQALQSRRGATVTAAAVDLDSGKTLAQLNPDSRLSPASLSKIVLAAAALETWPADKAFVTRVFGAPPTADGRLPGDLLVVGGGDATLDHEALWFLAAQVRQAGVRDVDGDLLIDPGPFGVMPCETKDRCDALVRTRSAYDAPLSGFGVDYGSWCVDIRAGQPATPAQIRSCAGLSLPIPLIGRIDTTGGIDGGLWMDRVAMPDGDNLALGGSIAPERSLRLYRSMGDPALGAGRLLKEALSVLGVTVAGGVRVEPGAAESGKSLLAQMEGLPLREQVQRLLRYSNNYISDVLLLDMAAERTPEPLVSLAAAARPLSELVLKALEDAGYEDGSAPPMFSGSGLTPENRLSARDLVAVLTQQYRRSETFPVYYAGLVVPGQAPYRYLRRGGRDWQERVALKTGTLTEPYSVFGTAGYLRKKDGGWIAFAALANGADKKPVPMRETLRAIQSDVERLLSRY